MSSGPGLFSLRILSVDSYLSAPIKGLDVTYSKFNTAYCSQVPVIRIFGITPSGAKCCAHIHGVFPYLFIPSNFDAADDMEAACQRVSVRLNRALNNFQEPRGPDYKNADQIFAIVPIVGIPFYGYHSQGKNFLKIFFYRPYMIKKAAALLMDGSVGGQIFQPHEAHVPFTLQFMMDYNLYGMNFMKLSKWTTRTDVLERDSSQNLKKMSRCEIEIDALAENIVNSSASLGDSAMNPGIAFIWEDEKSRRRNAGEDSQLSFVTYDNSGVHFDSHLEVDLKPKLFRALKERINKRGLRTDSQCLNATFSHEASFRLEAFNDPDDDIFDTQDREILQGFIDMFEEEERNLLLRRPEDGSILQTNPVEEELVSEDEIDMTQPFETEIRDDSDDEILANPLPQQTGADFIGDSSEPSFIEGSDDDYCQSPLKATPKRRDRRRKRITTPNRYKPLDVRFEKSPRKSLFSSKEMEPSMSCIMPEDPRPGKPNVEEQPSTAAPSSFAISPDSSGSSSDIFSEDPVELHNCFTLKQLPPSYSEVQKYILNHGWRGSANKVAHKSKSIAELEEFSGAFNNAINSVQIDFYRGLFESKEPSFNSVLLALAGEKSTNVVPVIEPPTPLDAAKWLNDMQKRDPQPPDSPPSSVNPKMADSPSQSETYMESPMLHSRRNSYMIDEATANNSGGFKMDFENLQDAHAINAYKYLTIFSVEIHVNTRGALNPNPEHDDVAAVFYSISNDVPSDSLKPQFHSGIIAVLPPSEGAIFVKDCEISIVHSEIDLFTKLIELVHDVDPDIMVGYEIEMLSLGYLLHRGSVIGTNLYSELSRLTTYPKSYANPENMKSRDFECMIAGRVVLNVWRIMRHEAALMSYSFENMMYHVFHTRVPHYSFETLTNWWTHISSAKRRLTINYYLTRSRGVLKLLEQLDIPGRTSELASLFGIQFYEVLSRGSQFRVESMMLRLAKPMNFVPVSPNIQQRAAMRAPACLPLIMEPHSRFYEDPVIVLDFQSLYPSMMIAYNYCFSTCLGRVENLTHSDKYELGCTELEVDIREVYNFKNHIHISPAAVAFVDATIRKGVVPRMLEEILETRLMVKQSMKKYKSNKLLQRILHARQLGLKLIANVTYGYTSANFSGRMACVEVADSVVSKGRETLERAIKMVKETKKWNAEVIYGDTDSLFVLCPGRTRAEAFEIGQEIADAVTSSNPKPVKLKLEKVYQPCFLQTKKRYVGYMYESPDQERPEFDAKGIETVRRDGCLAVSKILEKSLKILFETYNVGKVKDYVCRQIEKVFNGNLSLQDLIFAREYRGMSGYRPSACVPALKLTKEWLLKDCRAEPRVGERVGYVIVYGHPSLPLIKLVRSPHELLNNSALHLNADYYITKVILPPLQRCFGLMGVDVFSWYKTLPKSLKVSHRYHNPEVQGKSTISQYFATMNCLMCNMLTATPVCPNCQQNEQQLASIVHDKISTLERQNSLISLICGSCCSRSHDLLCSSLDCPVYFKRCHLNKKSSDIPVLRNTLENYI